MRFSSAGITFDLNGVAAKAKEEILGYLVLSHEDKLWFEMSARVALRSGSALFLLEYADLSNSWLHAGWFSVRADLRSVRLRRAAPHMVIRDAMSQVVLTSRPIYKNDFSTLPEALNFARDMLMRKPPPWADSRPSRSARTNQGA